MKSYFAFILLFLSVCGTVHAETTALPPAEKTVAYQQYSRRPKNELSKLIYLMDRFKGSAYTVLYDNVEYDSMVALKYAKSYIAKHYKKEPAESWVRENAYRSISGKVIYLKAPNGDTQVLRDALVKELKQLR